MSLTLKPGDVVAIFPPESARGKNWWFGKIARVVSDTTKSFLLEGQVPWKHPDEVGTFYWPLEDLVLVDSDEYKQRMIAWELTR